METDFFAQKRFKMGKTAFINNLRNVTPEYVNKVVNNLPTKLSTNEVENFNGIKWDKVGKFILILQLQIKKQKRWVTR